MMYVHWLAGPTKYSTYAVVAAVEQKGINATFVKNIDSIKLEGKVVGVTLLTTMLLDEMFVKTLKNLVERKKREKFKLVAGGLTPRAIP